MTSKIHTHPSPVSFSSARYNTVTNLQKYFCLSYLHSSNYLPTHDLCLFVISHKSFSTFIINSTFLLCFVHYKAIPIISNWKNQFMELTGLYSQNHSSLVTYHFHFNGNSTFSNPPLTSIIFSIYFHFVVDFITYHREALNP